MEPAARGAHRPARVAGHAFAVAVVVTLTVVAVRQPHGEAADGVSCQGAPAADLATRNRLVVRRRFSPSRGTRITARFRGERREFTLAHSFNDIDVYGLRLNGITLGYVLEELEPAAEASDALLVSRRLSGRNRRVYEVDPVGYYARGASVRRVPPRIRELYDTAIRALFVTEGGSLTWIVDAENSSGSRRHRLVVKTDADDVAILDHESLRRRDVRARGFAIDQRLWFDGNRVSWQRDGSCKSALLRD